MKSPTPLVVISLCANMLWLATPCRGDDLGDAKQFIEDGIRANQAKIASFQAKVALQTTRSSTSGAPVMITTPTDKQIYYDNGRWRQQLSTTWFNPKTGKTQPYKVDALFDGVETTQFIPGERGATVEGGMAMESAPTTDFNVGYRFIDWPLPRTIKFATSVKLETRDGGQRVFAVQLPHQSGPKRVTTLLLDPGTGFLIVGASTTDEYGTLVRERAKTGVKEFGGAWFLVSGEDRLWTAAGGERTLTEKTTWSINISDLPGTPSADVFRVPIPGNTLLTNNVTGQQTVTPGRTVQNVPPRKRWPLTASTVAVIVAAATATWFVKRRKQVPR